MKQFFRLATFVVVLGSVHLTHAVVADGKSLAAGTYQIRVTDEAPAPAIGQSPDAERWVEFLQGGKVVGREVVTVISAADMGAIAKGARPAPNGSLVQTLKGGDYVRVWINKDKINYLINLPAGK
jgi:hypothetical protein